MKQNNKNKIVHILSSSGLYGAEQVILSWIKHISKASSGFQLFIIVFSNNSKNSFTETAVQYGAKTLVIKPSSIFKEIKEVYIFLKKINPHIIHSHGYKGLFYGCLFSSLFKYRLIHTNHGFIVNSMKQRFYSLFEFFLLKHFPPHQIICVSDNIKSKFINYGVNPGILKVLTNAISIIPKDNIKLYEMPEDIKPLVVNKRIISYIGRLSYEKGADVLISAMKRLVIKQDDIFLILAGDGPLMNQLKIFANSMGLKDKIYFAGYRNDAMNIMANSEIIIMPSRTEGLPISLLEAMLLAKPVIASKVGGIPHVINHGADGILVPSENEIELSAAIFNLLQNEHLLRSIGICARKKIIKEYDIMDRVAKLVQIIYKLSF